MSKTGYLFRALQSYDGHFAWRLKDGRMTVCDVILKTLQMVVVGVATTALLALLVAVLGYAFMEAFVFPVIWYFQTGVWFVTELFYAVLWVFGGIGVIVMAMVGSNKVSEYRENHPPVCSFVTVV